MGINFSKKKKRTELSNLLRRAEQREDQNRVARLLEPKTNFLPHYHTRTFSPKRKISNIYGIKFQSKLYKLKKRKIVELKKHEANEKEMFKFCRSMKVLRKTDNEVAVEFLDFLLANPTLDVNAHDTNEITPIYRCCSNGNYRVLQILLNHPSIEVNKLCNKFNRQTALYYSCVVFYKYPTCFRSLLCHPKIDISCKGRMTKRMRSVNVGMTLRHGWPRQRELFTQYEQDKEAFRLRFGKFLSGFIFLRIREKAINEFKANLIDHDTQYSHLPNMFDCIVKTEY